MFKKQDNKYELRQQEVDLEQIGEKNMEEANILIYVRVLDTS